MAAASVESKAFDFVKGFAQENCASYPSTPPLMTGNCGRSLLSIKLGDLEPLRESSLDQQ